MSSSTPKDSRSVLIHVAAAAIALAGGVGMILPGCLPPDAGGGSEGDRCNPALSHDECGSGLQCTQPALCPENYCCPVSGPISNPYCQTGCAGGAAAICVASMDQDACAFAGMLPEASGDDGGSGGDGSTSDGASSD
jgi:hypothetical protein